MRTRNVSTKCAQCRPGAPQGLDGLWFEHAYIDIAQAGASCQTLNSTFDAASQQINMAFKVDYIGKVVPFTIIENYSPKANLTGYYTKKAKMPGSSLLTLPTVVVDVVPSSSDGSGPYEAMTLYSCINPAHAAQVTELVIATRSPTIEADTLSKLEATARAAGVTWNEKHLNRVDHSKCKNATAGL